MKCSRISRRYAIVSSKSYRLSGGSGKTEVMAHPWWQCVCCEGVESVGTYRTGGEHCFALERCSRLHPATGCSQFQRRWSGVWAQAAAGARQNQTEKDRAGLCLLSGWIANSSQSLWSHCFFSCVVFDLAIRLHFVNTDNTHKSKLWKNTGYSCRF